MLKIYDEKMNPIGYEDKKIVHQKGLWHKTVSGILYNPTANTLYFQTIYPKDSYTFKREDYIDFAIGGHVDDDETLEQTLVRESAEELGLAIHFPDCRFLGLRVCDVTLSPTYTIREFQSFYAIFVSTTLKNMDFSKSDGEVKSVIEISFDDYLSLLFGQKETVPANETTLDKTTRHATYAENVPLSARRIVPDYKKDLTIRSLFLSLKGFSG